MRRSFFLAILASFTLAAPASALNNRSAVSVNGLDTNACTPASPCRSFPVAIAATVSGGEVIALDTAGYGAFSVSTAMTISGAPGVHAAITVTSTVDGIDITATPSDIVTLRNLVLIDGPGFHSGISNTGSAELRVLHCLIRGFQASGIFSSTGRLTVDNCTIFDNGTGISINGDMSTIGILEGIVEDSLIESSPIGIRASGNMVMQITNCTIAGGGDTPTGVTVSSTFGTGALAVKVMIENSRIANCFYGVSVDASGGNNAASVYLAQNDITFDFTGVSAANSAVVYSYGNNRFAGTSTVGTLTPIALQ